MINTIELFPDGRIGAYEMPYMSHYYIDDEYQQALEAARREAVYFKEVTKFLEDYLIHERCKSSYYIPPTLDDCKNKPYPVPDGYEVKIEKNCPNVCDCRDEITGYINCKNQYAILVPKEKQAWNEQHHTMMPVVDLPKQQSIEEAAREYYNIHPKRVIDSEERYYGDYRKYDAFIAGAKSETAKEYWYEQFKQEKK